MTTKRRVFLLFADNRDQADRFLKMQAYGAGGAVKTLTTPEDRQHVIGHDTDDTPWLSIRTAWTPAMRELYDYVKLRYGPVWSERSWVEALLVNKAETLNRLKG